MKETLAGLAAKTGYSITTISRVLSGKAEEHRISMEARNKIIQAARENRYFPSLAVQNRRTNKTSTIGLMVPSIANPYFADIASSVIGEANHRNYTTIVIDSSENEEMEKKGIASLMDRQVDGIIAVPCGTSQALFEEMNREYLPVILIDRYFPDAMMPYVATNNYQGGIEATNHLIMHGHRRIACIQGVVSSAPNKKRVAGYLAAMEKAGIKDEAIVTGNEFSIQNGYLETKLLLNRQNRPTAIFTLSNTIMLGAVRAIRESGLKIPEDISIMTFDNNMYMDYMTPAISRISQHTEEMGRLATKLMFECISSGLRSTTQIELTPSLIAGASVGFSKSSVRQ